MYNVGDTIKLKEDLCPDDKRNDKRFQFGALNYPVTMLDWEFEVVRTFTNKFHGEMAECKVTNFDGIKSNVAIRLADFEIAKAGKVNLVFEILGKVNKFQAEIDMLKKQENELLLARAEEKKKGKPITDKVLVSNWNNVKNVREKIKRLQSSTEVSYKVKHSSGIYYLECAEADIPKKLRSAIRFKRNESRKLSPTIKDIGGGMTLEKLGNVMTKAGRFLELNEKYAVNIIKQHKKPTTTENYVGIEIEMLAPKSIELMNKEFIKARLHKYVNIGTDGSVRSETGDSIAMELRVLLPESLLASHLKLITDVLRRNDCYANRSCGMHVHLDMRNRDPELCYRNFFKVQDIMVDAQPLARRKNQYCKPNTKPSKKLSEFTATGDNDRRQAINTDSYYKNDMRTIEIRIHEGATKFKDIYNWVQFLVATASLKNELPKVIKTIDELRNENFVNPLVINHLEERIVDFSA